jgi:hypothetical protein
MLNIIWSDDAVDVLENIDYLERHWTKEVDTFLRKLMLFLEKNG